MKLLSYDSPMIQFLARVGDIILLNLLFLLCCLPVVTVGAAQAGLLTALKRLRDKEDDRPWLPAFFQGFAAGFWRITGLWCVFLVLAVLLMGNLIGTMFYQQADPNAPVWMSVAALCVLCLFEVMIALFHSRFSCTVLQLIKNAWLLLLAYPLHSVLVLAVTWLPLAVFLLDAYLFMQLTPVLLLAYFSLAYSLTLRIMGKPFQRLMAARNW